MPKKTYKDLPPNYSVCEHNGCPLAESCLHQIAYRQLVKDSEYMRLINPSRCSQSAGCKYYRNNEPVTYARGFTNFQKKMFPDQYSQFMYRLIGKFGRNPYFERRRGDSALTPREQQLILQTLKDCGVTEELKFDSYEQIINWFD